MTIAAALLIVLGAICELAALEGARRDLNDVDEATKARKESLGSKMAATKYDVDDWLAQVTRTREWGLYLFGAGVIVQAIAGLLTLS